MANEKERSIKMAFLDKDELKTVGQIGLIELLTNCDDSIITEIIEESIAKMKGFLSRFYDASQIFEKEGADRHKGVLKRLKDIVIYEIYERHTREPNSVAARRYAESVDWLERLNTGELGDNTLPPAPKEEDSEAGKSGDTRFGGNHRYTSIY